ncbi:UNVERIFIED_ORG: transposase [Citrobacter freundii]
MAKFSLEFKKEVSEKYLEDELSLKSVARMYGISPCTVRKWAYAYREHGIPSFGTVCTWLEKYRKYGEDAFIRKNKKIIPVPDKSVIPAPQLPALTEDEREELEQLRVENAYLKKLKVLVQQKTCSASRKK